MHQYIKLSINLSSFQRNSSGICLFLIAQLIICCIRVCSSAQEYDDLLLGEEPSSNRLQNVLFGHKSNYHHQHRKTSSLESDPKVLQAFLKLQIRPGLVRFSSTKPHSLPNPALGKRSKRPSSHSSGIHYSELVQDVCPSVSDWVARAEAIDPYGNTVTVVQRITLNGTVVNQYFYETFCAANLDYFYDPQTRQYQQKYQISDESECRGVDKMVSFVSFNGYLFTLSKYQISDDSECRGVDKMAWNSRCRENFIWTYGKVVTNGADTGWSVIAIRGSCGCAIWPKNNDMSNLVGRGRRVSSQHGYDNHLNTDPFY